MKNTLPALPVRSAADIPALELLLQAFPGKFRLDSAETARAIGITRGSIRTLRSRGTFKIPSQSNGGSHYFDIRDVAAFLDAKRTLKPRRGAPTKAERMAKVSAA